MSNRPRRSYSEEDRVEGLVALALYGSYRQAARVLKQQGNPIPEATLRLWREKYSDQFVRLRMEKLSEIEDRVISDSHDLIEEARMVAAKAIELERKRVQSGQTKDAAASAERMSKIISTLIDRSLALQGRPQRIEVTSGDDVLAKLARLGLVVDSSASEIAPATALPESNT